MIHKSLFIKALLLRLQVYGAALFGVSLLSYLPIDTVYLDLISQFNMHFLLLGWLAFFCMLVYKRRYALILCLPLCWQSYAIWQIHQPPPQQTRAKPFDLTLLHSNVLSSNIQHQKLFDTLAAHPADIISLQEVSPLWVKSLKKLEKTHPYFLSQPQNDNFGLALYSRYPLSQAQVVYLTPDIPTIVVKVAHPQRAFWLISTHPFPPIGAEGYQWRNQQYQQLVQLIKPLQEPVIVLGDLNSTVYSQAFQDFWQKSQLQHIRQGQGYLSSWPSIAGPFGIGIDHLLYSPTLQVQQTKVLPSIGSDHRPIWVKF